MAVGPPGLDGCPRFAKAYLGRKRWGQPNKSPDAQLLIGVKVCALSALCALCVEVCALSALCVEVCALSALRVRH